jgi:hypothetical protein
MQPMFLSNRKVTPAALLLTALLAAGHAVRIAPNAGNGR